MTGRSSPISTTATLRHLHFYRAKIGPKVGGDCDVAALSARLRFLCGEIPLRTGTVKWFNARKACGVIKPDDGGFNVHVKVSAIKRADLVELKDGQKVSFETAMDKRTGEILAENLKLLPNASTAPMLLTPLARRRASWFGRWWPVNMPLQRL